MLSRLAESLFWIGRYVERAEDTTRLLDVHVQLLLEDSPYDETDACRALLAAMGQPADPDEPVDVPQVIEALAFSDSPASIVGALEAARDNARGAREVISSEIWECLNVTYHRLGRERSQARRVGPDGFFRYVKGRTAMVAGLVDSTMTQDDGWHFLVLGRSLERVDMTARLLSLAYTGTGTVPTWTTMLRCCGAYEAYLRTYRGRVDPERAAGFMLLDRLFPRSVYHALATAERCLRELDPSATGRAGVDDEALLLLGRARTELEFHRVVDLLADITQRLVMLERTSRDTGHAVARRYFQHTAPTHWAAEVDA
jgi:uncharacterized alpha-E superfamily protein